MPLLIYDITRLWSRRNAPTPTGIDRVDINYAVNLQGDERFEISFVVQADGKLRLVEANSAKAFLQALHRRWTGGAVDIPAIILQDDEACTGEK